jgi:hypothetical protein
MQYSDFLKRMSDNALGFTLRDESSNTASILMKDIEIPKFWAEINEPSGLVFV